MDSNKVTLLLAILEKALDKNTTDTVEVEETNIASIAVVLRRGFENETITEERITEFLGSELVNQDFINMLFSVLHCTSKKELLFEQLSIEL